MTTDVQNYIAVQEGDDRAICERLQSEITMGLPDAENKVWHAHPVWFLDGNPIVGYSKRKAGIQLMFWSGADFDEAELKPGSGKFKDASTTYQSIDQINSDDLKRWLKKSQDTQWDYKNIIKNKGLISRIK